MIVDLSVAGVISGNRVLMPPPGGLQKKGLFSSAKKPPRRPVPTTIPKPGGSGGSFLRGGLSRPRWILFKRAVCECGGSSLAKCQASGETVSSEARSECKEIQITLCVCLQLLFFLTPLFTRPTCGCQKTLGTASGTSMLHTSTH